MSPPTGDTDQGGDGVEGCRHTEEEEWGQGRVRRVGARQRVAARSRNAPRAVLCCADAVMSD